MRYFSLVLMLIVSCRESVKLQRITKCGSPCYTLAEGKPDVGVCTSGLWICDEDQEETAHCDFQVGPSQEQCNGLDDDCDGRVDEQVVRDCSSSCGKGIEMCSGATFVGCSAPSPLPEECNGKDDDCDGAIDEPDDLPVRYCYSGPSSSTRFGTCQPGIIRCEAGAEVCFGEVGPKPESCNGIDDNCDGRIDENLSPGDLIDLVFVVDNSGSMGGVIAAVKAATNFFAIGYSSRVDLQWGLVVAPDPDEYYNAQVRRVASLGTANLFAIAFQRMASTGGGAEPTLDALAMLADPTNPLQMNWRSGSRHVVVMFSDEPPQSYTSVPNTHETVNAAILAAKMQVYVFTNLAMVPFWKPALPPEWSQIKELTSLPSVMQAELNGIVQEISCR